MERRAILQPNEVKWAVPSKALDKLEKEHGKRFSADSFWLENSEG